MSVKTFTFENLNGFGDRFVRIPQNAAGKQCLNFKTDGRILKDGLSVSYAYTGDKNARVELPQGIVGNGLFLSVTQTGERLLANTENGVYACDLNSENCEFYAINGVNCPNGAYFVNAVINGIQCTIIASGITGYVYDGYSVTEINLPAGTKLLSWHFGKLIAITESAVYVPVGDNIPVYGTVYGGSVYDLGAGFRAENAVISGSELIIAGSRGIYRLTRSDFGSDFVLRRVYIEGERIFPATLLAGADGALVLGERGLYNISGGMLSLTNGKIGGIAKDGLYAFLYGGDYHVCVKAAQNAQKRLILAFNGSNVNVYETYVKAVAANSAGETCFAVSDKNGYLCRFGGNPIPSLFKKVFITADTDFGINTNKTVTEFSIQTNKDLTLIITADGKRHAYRITGGNGRRVIRPYVNGNIFSFEINTRYSGITVTGLSAEIDY